MTTSRRSKVDIALAGSGVLAACCSVVFAGVMLSNGDHSPYVLGEEYLSIFSKPSHSTRTLASTAALEANVTRPAPIGVDLTPTGSISNASGSASAEPSRSGRGDIRLVSASKGVAWFESGGSFFEARAGDVLPRLGRIAAIQNRGGAQIVILENGTALLANAATGPTSDRSSHAMIFGP